MSHSHDGGENFCPLPDDSCNTDSRTVEERLDAIEETQREILTLIGNANTVIEKVVAEVKPTLDELLKSPMLRMLGVGKK